MSIAYFQVNEFLTRESGFEPCDGGFCDVVDCSAETDTDETKDRDVAFGDAADVACEDCTNGSWTVQLGRGWC